MFLSIGSNLGNKKNNLQEAIDYIKKYDVKVNAVSTIYETEPWGFETDNSFYNIVLKISTDLNALDLLTILLSIENNLGRIRNSENKTYISRIIDIDIITYDNQIIETEKLTIPHLYMHKRKFVLMPLQEIEPLFVHPALNKSIDKLLLECNDETAINKTNLKLYI